MATFIACEAAGALRSLNRFTPQIIMALQIIPILKALAPLIAQAGGVAAGLRSSNVAAKMEDRVDTLERETLRAGEVLTGLAQQLQAIAQELRVQAELVEAMRKKVTALLVVAGAAVCVGTTALIVAIAGE